MNLGHAEVTDQLLELWSKKVVVSDFSMVEAYQSDGNQSDNQTLHRCGILDRKVGSLSLVDDDLQLQVGFLYSI